MRVSIYFPVSYLVFFGTVTFVTYVFHAIYFSLVLLIRLGEKTNKYYTHLSLTQLFSFVLLYIFDVFSRIFNDVFHSRNAKQVILIHFIDLVL